MSRRRGPRNRSWLVAGDVFGSLTVIEDEWMAAKRAHHIDCRCSCGRVRTIFVHNLRSGQTKSCPECRNARGAAKRRFPAGVKVGRWTVLDGVYDREPGKTPRVRCRCDCGVEAFVYTSSLRYAQRLAEPAGCRECARVKYADAGRGSWKKQSGRETHTGGTECAQHNEWRAEAMSVSDRARNTRATEGVG